MQLYSSREVAKKLGLDLSTLNRYIVHGKVSAPPVRSVGGTRFREWTEEDIEKVRKILPAVINGRKTRYKKAGNNSQSSVSSKSKRKKNRIQPRTRD